MNGKRTDIAEVIANVIGLLLLAGIISMPFVVKCSADEEEVKTDTMVMWHKVYVPTPAETIRVIVPPIVDTVKVIQEYYTQKVYTDTVLQNDTVTLVVRDTLYQNSLGNRTVSLTFNAGRFVKTNSVGISGLVGRDEADLLAVYRHRRWQFAGGWNFVSKSPMVGVGYTLKEW